MAKQYKISDVAGIANAIFAFMGLVALTASFVGALLFWFFAWLQTPIVRKKVANKMNKEDFPFLYRTGFASAAFLTCMIVASGTQYSKTSQQSNALTEQPPIEQANKLPPGEPVATPTPTNTPKPQAEDKLIQPAKLSGLSQAEIKSILGEPTKTSMRNNWPENKYQVGGIKYSVVFDNGKSSIIDYFFDNSSLKIPYSAEAISKFGIDAATPKSESEASLTFSDLPGFSGAVLYKADESNHLHSACFSAMPGGLGC